MNSQYFPGSAEEMNRQAHSQLLKAAEQSRRANGKRSPRLFKRSGKGAQRPGYRKNRSRPTVLEPALTAVLTAAIALQAAILMAF